MTLRVNLSIDGENTGGKRAVTEMTDAVRGFGAQADRTNAGLRTGTETSTQVVRELAGEFAHLGRQAVGSDSAIVRMGDSAVNVWRKVQEAGDANTRAQQRAAEAQTRGLGTVLAAGTRLLGWIGIAIAGWELLKTAHSAFASRATEEEENLNSALAEQARIIGLVRQAYGEAAIARERFGERGRVLEELRAQDSLRAAEGRLRTEVEAALRNVRRPSSGSPDPDFGEVMSDERPAFVTKQEFEPFEEFIEQFEAGEITVKQLLEAVAKFRNVNPHLRETANEFLRIFDAAKVSEAGVDGVRQAAQRLSSDWMFDLKVLEDSQRRLMDMAPQRNRGGIQDRRLQEIEDLFKRGMEQATDPHLNPSEQAREIARLNELRVKGIDHVKSETSGYQQLTQRIRDNIEEMNAEIAAGDRGTEAVTQLRIARQLERQAKKDGEPVDRARIDALAAEAAATEKLLNLSRIRSDLRFERDALRLGETDRQIAERLRQQFPGDVEGSLRSREAEQMRFNDGVRQTNELIGTGVGFVREFNNEVRNGENAWKAAEKAAVSTLNKIADAVLDVQIKKLAAGLGGNFNLFNPFGGPGTAVAAPLDLAGNFHPGLYHRGRFPGRGASGTGKAHYDDFAFAPRFHSGRQGKPPWGPDEEGVIIDKREWILQPGQLRAALGMAAAEGAGGRPVVTINPTVTNNAGGAVQVATRTSEGGDSSINIDLLIERIDQRQAASVAQGASPLNRALEGQYGLNPGASNR